MLDIEELKMEREHRLRTAKDIGEKAKKDGDRALTDDEKRDVTAALKDADDFTKKINAINESEMLLRSVDEAIAENRQPETRRAPGMQPTNGQHPGGDDRPEIEFKRYGKLKAFKHERDAYKVGQWVRAHFMGDGRAARWCRDNGVNVETRAHNESVNSQGGVLVPEEFAQTVIDLKEQYGVFRQNVRVVPMGRDVMNMPRRVGGLTAYWASEGVAPTESTASWNNISLTAKKMGIYSLMSSELAEDAVVDIADWLANDAAYQFALKEDQTGFIGDGTSTYNGIQGISEIFRTNTGLAGYVDAATAGHDTFAEVDIADITGVMGKLPAYARMGAKWFMSQTAYDLICTRIAATAGGNTIQSIQGGLGLSFLGHPVVISQVLESSTGSLDNKVLMMFGNLELAATMGDRRSFSVATSADYKFAEDQIALRATQRIDINVHDYGDSTTAGPIVALIGKS